MYEQQLRIGRAALGTAALTFTVTSLAGEFEPFRSPNLSPPSAIIALPVWSPVPEATQLGFTTEIANHYRLKRRVDDQIVLDGETVRIRAYFEQPVGDAWSIAVDVPYLYQSGGVLDDLIDGWHSAFGLPDGARNRRPEGVLEYELSDAAGSFFRLDDSGGGIGDIQISLARRVGHGHGWHLRGAAKLPTGRESVLAGSGTSDWYLSAFRIRQGEFTGRAASYFFGLALIDIGQPETVRFPAEDNAAAAIAGGALALGSRFGVKGQIDVNSALYLSQLEELGQTAVQATLGGWLGFGDRGLFEFAVSEDLHVSTTPDVVLFFNLSWELR